MPFRRRFSRRRRSFRRPGLKRYGRKRIARRGVTRPVKKLVSRRRILNIASEKKKDNMAPYTSMGQPGAGTQPAIIPSSVLKVFLFSPSARQLEGVGVPGTGRLNAPQYRTNAYTYVKGYKERINFFTNSSAPWQWRRIVFSAKGPDIRFILGNPTATPPTGPGTAAMWTQTTNGYQRVIGELPVANQNGLIDYIFDGTRNVDWINVFTAKVDTETITLHSDKYRTLTCGNNETIVRNYNEYYSFNKNLLYDDDESGNLVGSSPYSTPGKQGMGDIYVMDIFFGQPPLNGTSALNYTPEGTYYWHEK